MEAQRPLCEAVKVKLGFVPTELCMSRKAARREEKQPERGAGRSWRSDTDAESGLCSTSLLSCFGPVFAHCAPFPPFQKGNVSPVPLDFLSM